MKEENTIIKERDVEIGVRKVAVGMEKRGLI